MLESLFAAVGLIALGAFIAFAFRPSFLDRRAENDVMSFRTLAQSIPAGIWRTDASGSCVFASRGWEELTGVAGEDAWKDIGWVSALHPDDKQRVVAKLMESVSQRERFQDKWRWLRPDGLQLRVKGVGAPEYDEEGNLAGYIVISIEIQTMNEPEGSSGNDRLIDVPGLNVVDQTDNPVGGLGTDSKPTLKSEPDATLPQNSPALAGLRQRYIDRKESIVADLRQSLEKNPIEPDFATLASDLHKLAGVAATFGEPELGDASRRLERRFKENNPHDEKIDALKREWPVFERAA